MKDFTKKGTKLPVIPVGIKFRTVCHPEFDNRKIKTSHIQRISMVSYGVYDEDYILCESPDYENHGGTNYFIIKLSTIERLAKEQGMWDDGITMTFKQYEPFRVLELQPDLKVTFPCGHEITIQTNQFLTTTDCEQCKTNQMNPTITLQENGDVIISNTETTTTLSKVTVDEICRLVKEQPKLRKINVWYGSKEYPKLCWRSDESNCYGLNWKGNWEFKSRNSKELSTLTDDDYELSPETVEQYLKAEAVKRGYEKGTKYKHIKFDAVEVLKQPENLKLNIDYNNLTDGCGGSIFDEGVWATILKPETITRAEAEKRYDVKITD